MAFRVNSLPALTLAISLAAATAPLAAGSEPPQPFNFPSAQGVTGQNPAQGGAVADRFRGTPEKPPRTKARQDKRSDWRDGYRAAVSLIQGARYEEAIAKLVSLDMTESPDVLNYIGYANRKMGRMEEARTHYEGALARDPAHRGALEYFGEWHAEMGKIEDARRFLSRLESACGTGCREYQDLADAIAVKTSI